MSVRTAAEQAAITEVTWSKIEKGGSTRPETLAKVAGVLGLRGALVADAYRDASRIPELLEAVYADPAGVDLSSVSDADLMAELERRLAAFRRMLEVEQGTGQRPAS